MPSKSNSQAVADRWSLVSRAGPYWFTVPEEVVGVVLADLLEALTKVETSGVDVHLVNLQQDALALGVSTIHDPGQDR